MKSFFTILIAGLLIAGSSGCDKLAGNAAAGDNAGVAGAVDEGGDEIAANDAGNGAVAGQEQAPDPEQEQATLEWLADQMRNIKDAGGETLEDSTE